MKLVKLVLLVMVFTSFSVWAAEETVQKSPAAEAHPYTAKSPKLNRAQVDALLAEPDEVLFIDVRRPDEISKIGGFPVYLNVQSKDLDKYLPFIPTDRKLVAVSNHAGRGGKSADLLADKGFDVVGAVGAQDYEAEGGKLSKVEIPAPKP